MCPVKKGLGYIIWSPKWSPAGGGGTLYRSGYLIWGGGVFYLCVGGFMAEGWGQGPDRGVGAGAAAEGTGGRR